MFRASLAVGLAGALACAAVALASDSAISTDTTATNLTTHAGTLVWSREAPVGTHHLVNFTTLAAPALGPPPRPTDLAIRTSGTPFDPDVGATAKSSSDLVVVYTRCAGISGRNCDLYRFDGKRERKVEGASSSRCSEFAPSIWKGTIAFGRTGPGRCRGLYVKGARGGALRLDRRVPADTDIRAGKVAYLHFPSRGTSVLRVFAIREGRSSRVISGVRGGGERTRVSNPILTGSYVYWLLEDLRRHDRTIGRRRGGPGSVLEWIDRRLPGSLDSFAVEGRRLFYTNGRGVHEATDPTPHFATRD